MSRIIAWRRFIEFRLEGDGGRPLEAFQLRPTARTRHALSKHRLLARPRRDGIALFYRINPETVPALVGEITERVRFSFGLTLRQPGFFGRYRPTLTASTGAGLQFDNLDAGGAILTSDSVLSAGATVGVADAVEIGRRLFPIRLDLTASSPTAVTVRNPIDATAVIAPVAVVAPAGASAASVQLDLQGSEGMPLRAVETPPGPLDRRIYADDELAGANGVLDIHWETAQTTVPAPQGLVYRAVFERVP